MSGNPMENIPMEIYIHIQLSQKFKKVLSFSTNLSNLFQIFKVFYLFYYKQLGPKLCKN